MDSFRALLSRKSRSRAVAVETDLPEPLRVQRRESSTQSDKELPVGQHQRT